MRYGLAWRANVPLFHKSPRYRSSFWRKRLHYQSETVNSGRVEKPFGDTLSISCGTSIAPCRICIAPHHFSIAFHYICTAPRRFCAASRFAATPPHIAVASSRTSSVFVFGGKKKQRRLSLPHSEHLIYLCAVGIALQIVRIALMPLRLYRKKCLKGTT